MLRLQLLWGIIVLGFVLACTTDDTAGVKQRPSFIVVPCDPNDPICQPPPPPPPPADPQLPPCETAPLPYGGAGPATAVTATTISVRFTAPSYVMGCTGPAKFTATVTGATVPVNVYWYIRQCTGYYNYCGGASEPWTLYDYGPNKFQVLIPTTNMFGPVRAQYTMVQVQEIGGAGRSGASKVQYQKGLAWGPEGGDNIVIPCAPATYDMTYSYYNPSTGKTTFYTYRWNTCSGTQEWNPGTGKPPGF